MCARACVCPCAYIYIYSRLWWCLCECYCLCTCVRVCFCLFVSYSQLYFRIKTVVSYIVHLSASTASPFAGRQQHDNIRNTGLLLSIISAAPASQQQHHQQPRLYHSAKGEREIKENIETIVYNIATANLMIFINTAEYRSGD